MSKLCFLHVSLKRLELMHGFAVRGTTSTFIKVWSLEKGKDNITALIFFPSITLSCSYLQKFSSYLTIYICNFSPKVDDTYYASLSFYMVMPVPFKCSLSEKDFLLGFHMRLILFMSIFLYILLLINFALSMCHKAFFSVCF